MVRARFGNYDPVRPADLQIAPQRTEHSQHLAQLDGRLTPFKLDHEPQLHPAGRGQFVLAQTKLLALTANDAADRWSVEHCGTFPEREY